MGAFRLGLARVLQCTAIEARGYLGITWSYAAPLRAASGFVTTENGKAWTPSGQRWLAQVASRTKSPNALPAPSAVASTPAPSVPGKEWFTEPTLDARALSKRIAQRIASKSLPPVTALLELIQRCRTPEEVAIAAQAASSLHAAMSAIVGNSHKAFPEEVSSRLLRACCKAGVPQEAVRLLRARGVYGLVLTRQAMYDLMRSLSDAGQGMGVLRVYAEAVKAGMELAPTTLAQVAKELLHAGEPELVLAFVDECAAAGRDVAGMRWTRLHAAANAGLAPLARALLEEQAGASGGVQTAGAVYAQAKVHLLLGDAKAAVGALRTAMELDSKFSDGVVTMLRQLLGGLAKREPASLKESGLVKTVEECVQQLHTAAQESPLMDTLKALIEELATASQPN